MRIRSLHPGTTMEHVKDATGFDLDADAHPPTTRPATPVELRLIDALMS